METEIISALNKLDFPELVPIAKSALLKSQSSSDFPRFSEAINSLPQLNDTEFHFNLPEVTITSKQSIIESEKLTLQNNLKKLIPWRKGPFNIFGIKIDAEWRSDIKFARLEKTTIDFSDKTVLDIGSGNGYYMFRLIGKGARVLGVEPYLLNFMQFNAIKKYAPNINAVTIPCGIEALPINYNKFDVILSMGIFYHRKSPFEHLSKIKSLLLPQGKVVLETLVIEGENGKVLVPEKRYAKMRNVWFIPSVPTLIAWMKRIGFSNIEIIDVSPTTTIEQRKTDWMPWESLSDFLDKKNNRKTIEGYPAPIRTMIVAEN